MRAATDLLEKGYVEHINFDEFIEGQKGVTLVHKERRNVGMTYVFILEVAEDKDGPSLSEQNANKNDS